MEDEMKKEEDQEEKSEQKEQIPETINEAKPEGTKEGITEEEPASQEEDAKPREKIKTAIEEKEKPLEKMTATELREVAKKIPGVTGATAMKKDQLIAVIKEARGIQDEAPVKKGKKAVSKQEVSIKELKRKVIQLKEEKVTAHKAREMGKVDILRRRINRLKKRTRKLAQV